MRKLMLGGLAALAFGAMPAAAGTSVDIPLSGVLPKACDISAYLNGPFDALDLTSTSVQGAESLTTNCNYGGSNTVTFTSANAGKLKSSGGQEVTYELSMSGGVLSPTVLSTPTPITFGSGSPANANFTRSMSVRLQTAAAVAGTYTDTITAVVTPN
jgi:spore coat protein U-like protein